jgi:putative addiction module component (TIGR02574 family)
MTAVEQILQHALALPIADRIALADRLDQAILSAIPNEVAEEEGTSSEELLAELNRRVEKYLNDPSTAISGDELIARLRRRQAAGR